MPFRFYSSWYPCSQHRPEKPLKCFLNSQGLVQTRGQTPSPKNSPSLEQNHPWWAPGSDASRLPHYGHRTWVQWVDEKE